MGIAVFALVKMAAVGVRVAHPDLCGDGGGVHRLVVSGANPNAIRGRVTWCTSVFALVETAAVGVRVAHPDLCGDGGEVHRLAVSGANPNVIRDRAAWCASATIQFPLIPMAC